MCSDCLVFMYGSRRGTKLVQHRFYYNNVDSQKKIQYGDQCKEKEIIWDADTVLGTRQLRSPAG